MTERYIPEAAARSRAIVPFAIARCPQLAEGV